MKIYISGPISGYEHGNLDVFLNAAVELQLLGHDVVVPHDVAPYSHDGECPRGYAKPFGVTHTSTACYIRGDLLALLACDAIYLIKDWERSVGARLEFDVAAVSGLNIYYQEDSGVEAVT